MGTIFGRDKPIIRDVIEQGKAVDAVLIALIPLILSGVYYLPVEMKRTLVLHESSPTAVTALTNHFVHFGGTHLGRNLIGYGLAVAYLYVLAVGVGHRRLFLGIFGVTVLLGPPVVTVVDLVVFEGIRANIVYGYSGVVAVLFGQVPSFSVMFSESYLSSGRTGSEGLQVVREDLPPLIFAVTALLFFGIILVGGLSGNCDGATCMNRSIHLIGFVIGGITGTVAVGIRAVSRSSSDE